ncbi:MAG: transporter substrate-binding domain-containing protein [Rhodanobacter sp.]|nr:MAG: transporter substrate-binding domain-containing protein [Rhodanobacter sp.]TAL95141.1 MAG: transporter substrate-binding domain-containing protein [Rhodanobacter sp.]TAM41840.1 MAG: transporter substrate-binding domain-containing protein [Rhodanobacter sp.]TAN29021.1 MAG: transporter substrate-binding domain-containing protein [Rhodanobacter sp.]
MTKYPRPRWLLLILALFSGMIFAGTPAVKSAKVEVYPIASGTAAMVTTATRLQSARQPLIVGVKVAPPFVIEDHGHYSGLAIDLWQETAADHGWKYVYKPYDLEGLLDAVSHNKVDVGIGAITATAAREKLMDFAHPITSSGLGVAVRGGQTAGWLAVVSALVSPAFLKVIATLALLLLTVGFLVWLLEHKRNPDQFGGSRRQGIFSGFWWAMVTMTTVGYGDVAPRTVGGRILGLVWMLAALVIVSFFTASITSALTVGQLSDRIRSGADLGGMQVASVPDSTSAAWLERQRFGYSKVRDVDAALAALAAGRVDAVVYDAPLMRWDIQQRYRGKLHVLPLVLERQDYAFALPSGSRLREPIDTSLLQRINAPDWPERLKKAFGESAP